MNMASSNARPSYIIITRQTRDWIYMGLILTRSGTGLQD